MTDALYRVIDSSGRGVEISGLPLDAISLGRGIFETMLVVGGRAVLGDAHRWRFLRSAEALGICEAEEAGMIFDQALVFADEAPWNPVRLRVALFGARGSGAPVGVLAARPAPPRGKSYRLAVAGGHGHFSRELLGYKTVNYLENLLERERAVREGFDDALWISECCDIMETTTANIFFCDGETLVTPPLGGILPGVVRGWVIEEAGKIGIDVREEDVPLEKAGLYRYSFVTNSIAGIAPVTVIGKVEFGDPRGQDWFDKLNSAYFGHFVA